MEESMDYSVRQIIDVKMDTKREEAKKSFNWPAPRLSTED